MNDATTATIRSAFERVLVEPTPAGLGGKAFVSNTAERCVGVTRRKRRRHVPLRCGVSIAVQAGPAGRIPEGAPRGLGELWRQPGLLLGVASAVLAAVR